MDRFTANFPRKVIETRFPFTTDHNDWLISIGDITDPNWTPRDNFNKVFKFEFCDTWADDHGAMEVWQAEEMAAVINTARTFNKNVWVHCHAGICRSGAVVEILGLLGWKIVEGFSPKRIPNTHVFNLLRKQFPELDQSWDHARKVILTNSRDN